MLKYRGDQARLFKLCSDLKWKQNKIAEMLDISPQVLSRYWLGHRELPHNLFDEILDLITKDALANGVKEIGLEERVEILEKKIG